MQFTYSRQAKKNVCLKNEFARADLQKKVDLMHLRGFYFYLNTFFKKTSHVCWLRKVLLLNCARLDYLSVFYFNFKICYFTNQRSPQRLGV